MPLERAERVLEVVASALELGPEERAAFLDQACADDPGVRTEVESLVSQEVHVRGFIEEPPAPVAAKALAAAGEEPFVSRQFGAYQTIREIGRGGLGTVYLAARADEAYQKEVALKLLRRGLDTDDILRRFRNERQILARLEHPNIARLIDGGTSGDGLPYFVMERVEGEPLTNYCGHRGLTTNERLQLFRTVCAAVAYAHQHLVIHRDLKPSNILVTQEGEVKLLDFGIAKLLGADEEAAFQTMTQLRVMTPEYASPEQVRGENITTASDVYSLGVVLYELLAGTKPYRLTSLSPQEFERAITEQEPPPPSHASHDSRSTVHNSRSLKGDLDNIVLMALRKEPERRYASVQQFAEDIRRYLEGLPVVAHQATLAYRSRKFVQRHKVGALAATLILLTLLAGVIAFAREAQIAAAQRDQAQLEKANAERVSAFLQNVLLLADPSWVGGGGARGHELTTEKLLETAATRARKELADQPAVLGAVLRSIGSTYRAQGEYAEAESTLREARAIFIRAAGETSWDSMNVTYNLAQCLSQAGQFAEADAIYGKTLPLVREQTNPADDRQMLVLAGMLNDYAFLLRLEGHPEAAEALLHEALHFAPRWHGAGRAIVGIHLNLLGLARDDQGDLEGAEKLERAAITELRSLPDGDRIELAGTLFSLGQILTTKGQLTEAERAIQEGLSICHRLLGDSHTYFASGQSRLATVQCARANYAEAQRLAREALALQEAKLPPEHIYLAYPLTTLGLALTRSHQAAEAEPFLRRALALREKTLPPNDWLVAETKLALAECLHGQGRKIEAEPLMSSGFTALVKAFAPSHPRVIAARAALDHLSRTE